MINEYTAFRMYVGTSLLIWQLAPFFFIVVNCGGMVRTKAVFPSCKHLKNIFQNKIKSAVTILSRAYITLVHSLLEVAIQLVSFLRINNAKSCVSNPYPENYTLH